MNDRRLRRMGLRIGSFLGGVLVLLALSWPEPPPVTTSARKLPGLPTAHRPLPRVLPREPGAAINAVVQASQDPSFLTDMMARYKEANRYEPGTVALSPGMVDAIDPDIPIASEKPLLRMRNLRALPDDRVYSRLATSRSRYIGPAPIELTFSAFRGQSARSPEPIKVDRAEAYRRLPSGERVSLGAVTLVEERPSVFTAKFTPSLPADATEDELIEFDVAWTWGEKGFGRGADRAMVFYTARPVASFTGEVREVTGDGSLALDVEVESAREGEAQVSGRLFARDGKGNEVPVAMAVKSAHLPVGRSSVRLLFYGLVFHDRGLSGPYTLRNVRGHFMAPLGAGRGGEIAHGPEGFRTSVRNLSAFTSKEWDSPTKRIALRAYEQEIRSVGGRDL